MKVEQSCFQKYFSCCIPKCCKKIPPHKKKQLKQIQNVAAENIAPPVRGHRKLLSTEWISFRAVLKEKK